jgi:predicted anti-sigma-YlaC factor YlaD
MHHLIRQSLEEYLKAEGTAEASSKLPAGFHAHLGECAECAGQLQALKAQSELLRSLRAPRDIEPRAGFYARVMERIEAQPTSIWSVFLERKFGLRLAVASAALFALLGTYLVTSEWESAEFSSPTAIVSTSSSAQASIDQSTINEDIAQQQQRDAVLVDLASYHQ